MFNFFSLFLLVLFSMVSVSLVINNEFPVFIDLYVIQISNISLGAALFESMIFGIIISSFFLLGVVYNLIQKCKKLKIENELAIEEVKNLRRIPIQE